jgi:hypothetical protein
MSDDTNATPSAPDFADSFEAAVREREGSRTKAKTSPKGEHVEAKAATEDTAASVKDTPASGDQPTGADTASAPDAQETSDLGFLPEAIRSKVPTLSKEVREWMRETAKTAETTEKRYKDLQASFTEKTTIRSEAEKKAALWDAVAASPAAARAASDALEREKAGASSPNEPADDGWDFSEHTSAENKAYIRKMAQAEALSAAKVVASDEVKQTLRREIVEPQEKKAKIGSLLATHFESQNIPQEKALRALAIAKEQAIFLGIEWTPENATRLADLGINLLPADSSANTRVASNGNAGLARVASPSSRGAGTTAPSIPKWQRDGLKWPKTADEKEAHFFSLDVGNVTPE